MEHVYKFVKDPSYVGTKNETFTHYWSNSSINFFDSLSTEDYLKTYYPNYHWEQCDDLGVNKTNIAYATLTIANWEEPVIFIKFESEDGTEIPSYYYATNPNSQTTPTEYATHTVYQLELDLWATIGWRFNKWLKEDFNEDIMFLRKMCDRYVFNPYSDTGYWIDFLKQPYLMRSGYSFNLIRDESEKSLTLEEWLWINSGMNSTLSLDYWLESKWFPWLENQWSGFFDTNNNPKTATQVSLIPGVYQNINYEDCKDYFNDSDYNSNGKYKWIAIKTGNNTVEYDADGKRKAWKGSVFKDHDKILLQKGKLENQYASIKTTIDKGELVRESENSNTYSISKTGEITYSGDTPVKAIISFGNNELLTNKFIKLIISRNDLLDPKKSLKATFFIADRLDKILRQIDINSFASGVEYSICKFNKKRIFYQDSRVWVDIKPEITLKLNDSTYTLKFSCTIQDYFGGLDYKIDLANNMSFNGISVYDYSKQPTTQSESENVEFRFNGEEVMYIPVKKGFDGQKYIEWLNNSTNLIFANQNVMGMPINDIPPSVLAMAIRSQSMDSEIQSYGDMLSTRQAGTNPECPLDIVQLGVTGGKIPVVFNSLNYIPITLATSPRFNRMYEVIGGTNFFNKFYNVMTNELLSRYNTMESDPIFLAPQFFQWVYFMDGGHRITLTPDMIDWYKVVTKSDWTVKLNVNMTDTTHLKLDIGDVKYDLYPFTKSQSELISADMITHPYSTEGFNNFMANNQFTQETSKNAKDIQNYWAKKNLPIYQAGSIIGGLGEGVAGGAAAGGVWGAIAGGVGGLVGGITEAITMKAGLENKIKMVDELWNNQWSGMFNNMYSAPSLMNPSGFGSGSLIYSDVAGEKNEQMELFRTFEILDLYKKMVWDDISVNGYGFCSQCNYRDYDNRVNFNMVNCNFDDRDSQVNKFLRERIGAISTLFAQQNFVDWYKLSCKSGIRLWKVDFSEKDTYELILGNIENNYKPPFKPTAKYVKYEQAPLPLDVVVNDNFDDSYWNDRNNYKWISNDKEYILTKTTPHTEKIIIPYTTLFGSKIYSTEQFIANAESLATQYDTSSIELKSKTSTLAKDVNQALYTLTNIDFVNGTTHYERNVINQVFNAYPFGNILKAINGDDTVPCHKHEDGWNIVVDLTDGTETNPGYATINLKEINNYYFTNDNDITTWTIKKQSSTERYKLTPPVDKEAPNSFGTTNRFEKPAHPTTENWPATSQCIFTTVDGNADESRFIDHSNPPVIFDKILNSEHDYFTNISSYTLLSNIPETSLINGSTLRFQIHAPIGFIWKDDNGRNIAETTEKPEIKRIAGFTSVLNKDLTFTISDITTNPQIVGNMGFEALQASDASGNMISLENHEFKMGTRWRVYMTIDSKTYDEKEKRYKCSCSIHLDLGGLATEAWNYKLPAMGTPRFGIVNLRSLLLDWRFDRTQGSLLDIIYSIPTTDIALEEHNKLNSLIFIKKEE